MHVSCQTLAGTFSSTKAPVRAKAFNFRAWVAILALFTIFILKSDKAVAQSAGLLPITQTHDPVAERVSQSTFRIISFANAGVRPPRRVATETLARLSTDALRFPMNKEARTAFQAEACRVSGLAYCPVFDEESRGTAFSFQRSARFMTCRHLFHDWFHWAHAYNPSRPIRSLVPPFVLVDHQGKLAFVSIGTTGGGFRISLMLESAELGAPVAELTRSDLIWDADVFGFDLMDGLGVTPLTQGPALRRGDRVSFLGYPDIDGEDRPMMSRGVVTERRVVTSLTSAASAKGMSGGPILDAGGHVTGMSCSLGRGRPGGRKTAFALPVSIDELTGGLAQQYGIEFKNLPP